MLIFKILYKLITLPIKIIVIPVIPFAWVTVLFIIFLMSGGDKNEFNKELHNLNQTTKIIYFSLTKGLVC